MAKVLRDAGWSTCFVGKDYNIPVDEMHMGASKKNWPLGLGFDRFYGCLGGETRPPPSKALRPGTRSFVRRTRLGAVARQFP
jgi:arylsulfatase A-like enzyme